MKIAFLISAYTEPEQLGNIVRALNEENVDFFIHVDAKVDIRPFISSCPSEENVHFVEDRERVCWGGFTQVDAIMKMLKCALQSKKSYGRFVSMTGTDYPVMSNSEIQNFFEKNKEKEIICTLKKTAVPDLFRYELNDYGNITNWGIKVLKKLIYIGQRTFNIRKRKLPQIAGRYVEVFSGSDYWAISEECARYIYHIYENDKKYNKWMKSVFIPSEKYVQTIMGNSQYASRCVILEEERNISFLEFSPLHYVLYGRTIKILDIPDYHDIIHSGKMLARKIYHEQSRELIKLLDEYRNGIRKTDAGYGMVSIIIPAYNREKAILGAIESVKRQTYKNLEYLIIDDGSTDHTYDVCTKIIEEDFRGRLFHKENGGVSSARNLGIENAKGQYIFFLDSDDMLVPDTIERLVEIIQKYRCVVAQGCWNVVPGYSKNECTDMAYDEYFCSLLHEPSVCGKLYTRDIIGSIRFDENLPVREDVDFLYRIMKRAQRIVVLNSALLIIGRQIEHLNKTEEYRNSLFDVEVSERAIELFANEKSKEMKIRIWGEYFNALIQSYVYCIEHRKEIQKKFRKKAKMFWKINRTSFKARVLLILGGISLDIYKLEIKKYVK